MFPVFSLKGLRALVRFSLNHKVLIWEGPRARHGGVSPCRRAIWRQALRAGAVEERRREREATQHPGVPGAPASAACPRHGQRIWVCIDFHVRLGTKSGIVAPRDSVQSWNCNSWLFSPYLYLRIFRKKQVRNHLRHDKISEGNMWKGLVSKVRSFKPGSVSGWGIASYSDSGMFPLLHSYPIYFSSEDRLVQADGHLPFVWGHCLEIVII